ncbi:MAG: tRNA (guanine(10)-N(2))-dimethyltransferase [Methanocella sp.]
MPQIKEGQVTIEMGEGVFYNPRMEMNRDISVACVASMPAVKTYVDAMAASGIRGIRVKKEVPRELDVTVNDWDAGAFQLLQQNAVLNDVAVNVSNRGANTLLSCTQFDYVDLDPFGTPAPYIDSTCRAAKVAMAVTATDTAPLCGAHLHAGMRRYAARPVKTEYYHEVGLRILLGKVVREQAKYDKAVRPLLCHATEHYVRLYLEVQHGVIFADRMVDQMGFLVHCFKCHSHSFLNGLTVNAPERCPVCGGKAQIGGPMWLGDTKDDGFVDSVIETIETGPFGKKERALRMLRIIRDEIDVPMYYDHHILCRDLKATPTTIGVLIDALRAQGFRASRTHYSGTGFKTDAPVNEIKSTILRLSPPK